MTTIQFLSIFIPVIVAMITNLLTYFFAIRSKRFDLYYQRAMPAFKEIAETLTNLRSYCLGRVAYFQGNEFSPYYANEPSALHHRTKLAKSLARNAIYLSSVNKKSIENLLNLLSIPCNIELSEITSNNKVDTSEVYTNLSGPIDLLIEQMFNDLKIKP